jgi:hypothetical protein
MTNERPSDLLGQHGIHLQSNVYIFLLFEGCNLLLILLLIFGGAVNRTQQYLF